MPSPDDSQNGVQNSTDGFDGPDSRGSESANGRYIVTRVIKPLNTMSISEAFLNPRALLDLDMYT